VSFPDLEKFVCVVGTISGFTTIVDDENGLDAEPLGG
jgi:hypothetical protein